jgi:GNAT superfamily N-acetyltransferase
VTYSLTPSQTLPPASVDVIRRIYEEGFPPEQRSEFPALLDGRQPGEVTLALTGPGSVPCGLAMLRPLGPTGWIYLRYFVVDAARRSQGLGGVLWDQVTAAQRAAGYSLLVFDVEDPAEPGATASQVQTRLRRIAFYERHGAAVLPVTGYGNPHGDEPEPAWDPMLLMAAGLAAGGPPTASGAGLRSVVEAVYRYRWDLAPDDPQVLRTGYAGGRNGPAGS